MSVPFNTLSRIVISFLPRSRCLLISWLQSVSAMIFEPKKMKTVTGYTFSTFHEVIVLDDTTLMAESEELKSLLMKVKEESKKLA